MHKKNILFLIPDGVGIRNYLYSDIIPHLKEKSAISIWSPLPLEAFEQVDKLHQTKVAYSHLKLEVEPTLSRFLRESAIFARLKHNANLVNNKTILSNWNYKPKSKQLFILNKLMQIFGLLIYKNYSLIIWFEKWSKLFWSKKLIETYKRRLTKAKINKIFITHQRVVSLMPICIAAKELGIEVITVIYSWDNLPKARLNVIADKYLVWSEYMKGEMKMYYPEIASEKIIVTGTPQFEFYYKKKYLIDRNEFANKYHLDPSKKWICFSGDDELTSPYDPVYLNDLAEEIALLPEDEQPQIIFRRSPADVSDRYDTILKKNKNVYEIKPEWFVGKKGWTSNFPMIEDVKLLVNIVFHSEIVFNIGSTMAFDFGMFSKPCGYINYDYDYFYNWSTSTIYKYQHFKSIENINAVFWINNKEDYSKILKFKENNCSFGIKSWSNKITPYTNNSSKIISEILVK